MKRAFTTVLLAAISASAMAMTPGEKSGVFLTLPQGARPTAMGEAYTAVTGDVYGAYWNPAGLADVENVSLSASISPTYLDMYYGCIAGAARFGDNAFSLAISHFNYGDMIGLDEHARNETVFGGNDFAISAIYARQFSGRKIMVGLAAKMLQEVIEEESATASMIDIGVVKKFRRAALGLSVRNIGQGLTFHDESGGLPATLSVGAVYGPENTPLLSAASIDMPADDAPVFSMGAEYSPSRHLSLRAGIRTERDEGFLSWMRFGFGTSVGGISVDYAMIPGRDFGSTHIFSVGYTR